MVYLSTTVYNTIIPHAWSQRRARFYGHEIRKQSSLHNDKIISPTGDRRELPFAPQADRLRFENRQSPPVNRISHPDAWRRKTHVKQSDGPIMK